MLSCRETGFHNDRGVSRVVCGSKGKGLRENYFLAKKRFPNGGSEGATKGSRVSIRNSQYVPEKLSGEAGNGEWLGLRLKGGGVMLHRAWGRWERNRE